MPQFSQSGVSLPLLLASPKFSTILSLKVKFSSILRFKSSRLVLGTERTNLTRQSILGSLAIRKFVIKPYYVDFLLMSQTLNYGTVRFNLIPQ